MRLPQWTVLLAPPSTWPSQRTHTSYAGVGDTEVDAKVLKRIRGLLAKAEATNFAEEAEIFTAKAQELMTRYAIDSALLHSRAGVTDTSVNARRIHIENPYVKEKVHLLTEIGESNRVRTVWFSDIALADRRRHSGRPSASRHAVHFTTCTGNPCNAIRPDSSNRGGSRTTSFRKGFLAGFASRIGHRLRDAGTKATAEAADAASMDVADLLPILATTSEAVDAEFDRLFPTTRKTRGRSVDAEGWHAGQAAADDANLRPGAPRREPLPLVLSSGQDRLVQLTLGDSGRCDQSTRVLQSCSPLDQPFHLVDQIGRIRCHQHCAFEHHRDLTANALGSPSS